MTLEVSRRADDRAKRRLDELIVELNELEEETYRLSLLHAKRVESLHEPASAERAIVGHIGESLDEIHRFAHARQVRTSSIGALVTDAVLRVVDAVAPDRDAGARAHLAQMRGVALVPRIRAVALDQGNEEFARWCVRWLSTRVRLIDGARTLAEPVSRPGLFRRDDRFAIPAK